MAVPDFTTQFLQGFTRGSAIKQSQQRELARQEEAKDRLTLEKALLNLREKMLKQQEKNFSLEQSKALSDAVQGGFEPLSPGQQPEPFRFINPSPTGFAGNLTGRQLLPRAEQVEDRPVIDIAGQRGTFPSRTELEQQKIRLEQSKALAKRTGEVSTIPAGGSALVQTDQGLRLIQGNEKKEKPQKVGTATRPNNEKVAIYRNPDGTEFEVSLGKVRGQQRDPVAQQLAINRATDSLAKRYKAETGNLTTRAESFASIMAAGRDQTGASDILLVYNFVRMRDPNAVKEGEIALVLGAGRSVGQDLVKWFNYLQLDPGRVLPEKIKQQFVNIAVKEYDKLLKPRLEKANKRFERIATSRKIDPRDVVLPLDEVETGFSKEELEQATKAAIPNKAPKFEEELTTKYTEFQVNPATGQRAGKRPDGKWEIIE